MSLSEGLFSVWVLGCRRPGYVHTLWRNPLRSLFSNHNAVTSFLQTGRDELEINHCTGTSPG